MNDMNVNEDTVKRIGGQLLPSVAQRYGQANGFIMDAANVGNMHERIKPKYEQLRALVEKAVAENAQNLDDAGRAVLRALGDFSGTDDLNSKKLLDHYNTDVPVDPRPEADPIHGRNYSGAPGM